MIDVGCNFIGHFILKAITWTPRCWLDSMIIAQVCLRLATIKGHSKMCSFITQHNATDDPMPIQHAQTGAYGVRVRLVLMVWYTLKKLGWQTLHTGRLWPMVGLCRVHTAWFYPPFSLQNIFVENSDKCLKNRGKAMLFHNQVSCFIKDVIWEKRQFIPKMPVRYLACYCCVGLAIGGRTFRAPCRVFQMEVGPHLSTRNYIHGAVHFRFCCGFEILIELRVQQAVARRLNRLSLKGTQKQLDGSPDSHTVWEEQWFNNLKKTMLFAPSISIPWPLGTIFTVPCYCSSSVRLTAA